MCLNNDNKTENCMCNKEVQNCTNLSEQSNQSKGETTKFTTRLRYYSFGNNAVKLKPAGPAGPACGLLCVDRPANLFLNFLQGIPVVILL